MQEPSTRLIVKNVPKHVDEKRLRQHFAEKGEVSFVAETSINRDHPRTAVVRTIADTADGW